MVNIVPNDDAFEINDLTIKILVLYVECWYYDDQPKSSAYLQVQHFSIINWIYILLVKCPFQSRLVFSFGLCSYISYCAMHILDYSTFWKYVCMYVVLWILKVYGHILYGQQIWELFEIS